MTYPIERQHTGPNGAMVTHKPGSGRIENAIRKCASSLSMESVVPRGGAHVQGAAKHALLELDLQGHALVSPEKTQERRRNAHWLVILASGSTLFSVYFIWDYGSSPHLRIALGTTAVVISAFGVRGPDFRYGTVALEILWMCICLGVYEMLVAMLLSADPVDGDIYLLVLAAFCAVIAVGVIAWSLSTWGVGAGLQEPVALVVTAVLLGGISMIGLSSAATTIKPVEGYGSGSLFLSTPDLDVDLT